MACMGKPTTKGGRVVVVVDKEDVIVVAEKEIEVVALLSCVNQDLSRFAAHRRPETRRANGEG